MKRKVKIGSRDSVLAVKQAELVIGAIARSHPELDIELVTMKTTGDLNLSPFDEINKINKNPFGVKGLFVKELERALLEGQIDLAVHSLKDMPMKWNQPKPLLPILAFSRRGDPRDALVSPLGHANEGGIGCSSARRRVQLERLIPGCSVLPIRGNVLTRLKKLDEGNGGYSSLVLAAAGLIRLGLESRIHKVFSPDEIVPAAGQGILACQGRQGRGPWTHYKNSVEYGFLDSINDPDSEDCARCETAFVERLGGGCALPVAAYAEVCGTELRLIGFYADEVRGIYRKGRLSGDRKDAIKLGETLAERLEAEDVGTRSVKGPGSVTLVGAGPGDPGLLTLKGRSVLEEADVVVYDRLVGEDVLNYASPDAELIDAGKRGGRHPVPQNEIEKILIEKAGEGKKVVRLKGGDPFLFGRGGEEMAVLAKEGIACEAVPGVTSATAVPAYAGISVTHRDYSSSVHVVAAHKREGARIDYETLARLEGTLVFLMGASRLAEISERLTAAGMDANTPAAVIENGTTSRQRQVIDTLGSLSKRAEALAIKSPAVIVVGQVAALGEVNNYVYRPLTGKRVIVPVVTQKERGKESGRFAALLRSRGAEAIEIPVSRIEAINAPLPPLGGYSWIVFTSAAGVEKFFERLRADRRDIREIGGAKIAAIGPATRDAIESRSLKTDLVPPVYDGTALGEALCSAAEGRILLLRAEDGAPELAQILNKKGLSFDEVPVYRTIPLKAGAVEFEGIDAAAFTCASSVRYFAQLRPGARIRAACIGERTAKAAREAGYEIYMAAKATFEDLADAVEEAAKPC
ncbi:MAG: uroporphyrinogen-III C-methyltransferase [Synergistaceae bacterium]|nr:uroporphyrinogen-III C-methyltransferase [Synergistaceae bacterium]